MIDTPVLAVRDLVAGYGEQDILHGICVDVQRGGFVSVIGPNGAGKSTLLNAIYGLLRPRGGTISLRTQTDHIEDIGGRKPHRLTGLGMNYVPQLANVFPSLTVLENLHIGATVRRSERSTALEQVFELFPLLHERRRSRAGALSGGQRKMLAVARAYASGPRLLLLDEPSAGLAPTAVDDLFEKLLEIQRAGTAILMVEQNARRSLAASDYCYVLDMGRNRFQGAGTALLEDEQVTELYLGGRRRGEALE